MHSKILQELGIPESYGLDPRLPTYAVASDLVDVEPNIVGVPQRLEPRTADAWSAMKTHAHRGGVELLLVSGFRTLERQADLLRRKLERGIPLADILATNVAPGFSQHHTGRAVDIAAVGCPPLVEAFEDTDAFAWLTQHAATFGFDMPYGRGNALGLAFEPWHWFYGGI
jgi:D-alanyl-D-alanine carboxypeptidase